MIINNQIIGEDDGSLNLLMALFKQYSEKLQNTMNLIKANKPAETQVELAGVKDALTGILTVFKEKSQLSNLPLFGQISGQLSQLSSITDALNFEIDTGDNKMVDGMVDKLKNAFSLITQVKHKIGEKVQSAAGGLGSN
jgi:hypothetical protein